MWEGELEVIFPGWTLPSQVLAPGHSASVDFGCVGSTRASSMQSVVLYSYWRA
jgi:hypothetical protein